MPTTTDLGRKAKAKFPGQYDDLTDREVGILIKQKYPNDYFDFEDVDPKDAVARSSVSKALEVGERVLNVVSDPATKRVYAPLAERIPNLSPTAKAKLKALESQSDVAYPSDVVDIIAPGMLETSGVVGEALGRASGLPFAGAIGKVASRLAIDALGDPLTFLSFGTTTPLGAARTAVREAALAGRSIKIGEKLSKNIAKLSKLPESAGTIGRFKRAAGARPETLSQSLARGETALASLEIPFTGKSIPLLTGKPAAKLIAPLSNLRRAAIGSKIERGLLDLFSNKTGIPEFDELYSNARDIAYARAGLVIEEGKVLTKKLDDLSQKLGVPREQLGKQISNLVETATEPVLKKITKPLTKIQKAKLGKQVTKLEEQLQSLAVDKQILESKLNPDSVQPIRIKKDANLKDPKTRELLVTYRRNLETKRLAAIQAGNKVAEEGLNKLLKNFDKKYSQIRTSGKKIIRDPSKPLTGKGNQYKDLTKQLDEVNTKISGVETKINNLKGRIAGGGTTLTVNTAKQKLGKEVFEALETAFHEKLIESKVALKNAQRAGDVAAVEQHTKDVYNIQHEINKLKGSYQIPSGINPEIDDAVREFKELQARQLYREQASGLPSIPLLADIDYLAHIMTPELREALIDKFIKAGKRRVFTDKELSEYLANNLRRQLVEIKPQVIDAWADAGIVSKREARRLKSGKGLNYLDTLHRKGRINDYLYTQSVHTLTIDEVNALPSDVKKKIFGIDAPEIFHTDPAYATTVRGVRGEQARTAAEFYNQLKNRGFALEAKNAPSHWVEARPKELAGYRVRPEIAPILNRMNAINTDPTALKTVLKNYDRFHRLSKAWTLAVFPAYHTLNIAGNFWNNWLGGVTSIKPYIKAAQLRFGKRWKLLDESGKVLKDQFGKEWTTKQLLDEADRLGVVNKGQYAADPQKVLKEELERAKLRLVDFVTPSGRNAFLRGGLKVGTTIENNARMAHFIDRIMKGDTAEQAAISVKKFLFDYADLSPVEQKVMNRAFFFYAWTRKNIPLQLQMIAHKPSKFAFPYRLQHEVEKLTPEKEERYLAEWTKENFPVRLRYNKENKTYEYFLLRRWLPALDITKLFELHNVAAQMLAPLPKETLQQLFNWDFYFKRKIEDYPLQQEDKKFLRMQLPKRVVHGLKLVRLLNEIDKMSAEDETFFNKIVGVTTGKNMSFDPIKGVMYNTSRVDEEIAQLEADLIRKARRNPTPGKPSKEMLRIIELMKEKAKEY